MRNSEKNLLTMTRKNKLLSSTSSSSAASPAEPKEVLEIQDPDGSWRPIGPVTVLKDEKDNDYNNGDSPATGSSPSSSSSIPSRQQLPKMVKALLLSHGTSSPSPAALTNRKDYYLFRHAPGNERTPNTNLLILLHGAGDTHVPFDTLARTMALPQTATLSISARGYTNLPFGLGCTWFPEMDYSSGEALPEQHPIRQNGIDQAVNKLMRVLTELAVRSDWIVPERVFLLGYGAGATLVSTVCQAWNVSVPLGGAVCVGGGQIRMPSSNDNKNKTTNQTPILWMVGEKDTGFSPTMARHTMEVYGRKGEIHVEPHKGQGMIQSASEMKVVMEFLAPKLVRVSSMS